MIISSQSHIQTTDNQIIVELWCGNRKLSMYVDKKTDTAEIYQFENGKDTDSHSDFIQAFEWLTTSVQPERRK